jgi:hypothetical protein
MTGSNIIHRLVAQIIEVKHNDAWTHRELESLSSLCSRVDEVLPDARPAEAWNALCLVWQHYECIAGKALHGNPSEACNDRFELLAWQSLHQVCCLLSSAAKDAPQATAILLKAQLAFNSAKVCSSIHFLTREKFEINGS